MPVFLIVYGRLSWRMWEKVNPPSPSVSWVRRVQTLPATFYVILGNHGDCPEYPSAQHNSDWVEPELTAFEFIRSLWAEGNQASHPSLRTRVSERNWLGFLHPSFEPCPAKENRLLSPKVFLVPWPRLRFGLTPGTLFIVDAAEGDQTFPSSIPRAKLHCVYHKVTALPYTL